MNQFQYHLKDIANSTSFLADHIYTPETILTSWFNLSFSAMTVAMVFYGIAMHKKLAHHLFIEVITVGLITLSIYYTYNGFLQYDAKLQYAMKTCLSNRACSTVNMAQIKTNQRNGLVSSMVTISINVLIAILIMYDSYKRVAA
jgi:hypothetical protein